MTDHVLLLGRASYGARRTRELEQLAVRLAQQAGCTVSWAVIDGEGVSAPAALDRIVETLPTARIIVVPVTLPSDVLLERWVTRVVRRWLADRPGAHVVLAPPLAEADALVPALAAHVARHATAAPLTVRASSPDDPAWSVLPAHRFHLLVCRGPRCTAAGAGEVAAVVGETLERHGLGDEHVLLAGCGCLFPCNLGPIAVVYPDRVWYGGLTPESSASSSNGTC